MEFLAKHSIHSASCSVISAEKEGVRVCVRERERVRKRGRVKKVSTYDNVKAENACLLFSRAADSSAD